MTRKTTRKTTKAAKAELEAQQASGTHKPASQCPTCHAWRTPGLTHTPPGKTSATCTG